MAVSALELRPRGPLPLFDAAIRLCSRSSGVWALTLPAGALVTAAALHLFDALEHKQELLLPCALFTAAWFARGVFQGAACHYVEQLLLGVAEPTTTGSLKAALFRLPSLLVCVTYLAVLGLLGPVITVGLYYVLMGSHLVGYAVTMQGKGHPLSLYGTCSKTLGAARNAAVWVRALFLVQVLVIFNVHVAANVVVYLGQKILALDLTFADRFVSLDNGAWVTAAIAIGFTLFEPLRAAVASLLLIDGRVRQEGLDLVAAIEQLPTRRTKKEPKRAAVALLLAVALGFGVPARAEGVPPISAEQAKGRLSEVVGRCHLTGPTVKKQLDAVGELSQKEQASLSRFLADVEADAEDGDCETASARLKQGLPLIVQTRDALAAEQGFEGARERAARILARPEFTPDPEELKRQQAEEPEVTDAPPPTWWMRFKEWLAGLSDGFWDWLKKLFDSKKDPVERRVELPAGGGGGAVLANVLVVVLVVAVLVVLVLVLLKARRKGDGSEAELDMQALSEGPLSTDPMSALSRPPEGWASLADELAARGDFREAVRSLYLALLSRLHRVGAIDYDPARSNWDYFRAFKGKRDWVPPFRELTNRFDFTYYGNLGASLEGYRDFRSLSQPLLVDPVPESGSTEAVRA
ncbi:MAG: DUF4129 domain-containing protein [Myxococcaceae bacterium]